MEKTKLTTITKNKKTAKSANKYSFKCTILGHQWEGDSLKRICTRCGKTQVAKYVGNEWVDVTG